MKHKKKKIYHVTEGLTEVFPVYFIISLLFYLFIYLVPNYTNVQSQR